jgi:molybdopterin molybdotransferase
MMPTTSIDTTLVPLQQELRRVGTEPLDWSLARHRVLAQDVLADRDNPALDVSAMDGYAVRMDQLKTLPSPPIPVQGTVAAGMTAPELLAGYAMRVFTGAPTPRGCECVVKREDTHESESSVVFNPSPVPTKPGDNIRRQGENAIQGSVVARAGVPLTAANIGAAVSFGAYTLQVFRPVRVHVINTGDELKSAKDQVMPWQIRDSNGPTLEFLLGNLPWVQCMGRKAVDDRLEWIADAIAASLDEADAVLLTGGVSMGDADHVPAAVQKAGATIVFHRIPIRPGRPVLGAVGPKGQLIFGMPGNPVSVAVTARRFGIPLLKSIAGWKETLEPTSRVRLLRPDSRTLPLTWYRLARWVERGAVELVDTRGSGDQVSLGASDGFVEIPPNGTGEGPWAWYPW